MHWLLCEYWDLNSGPPACEANTKPSCSLSVILFRKALCFMTSLGIGSGIIFNPRTHQFIRRHQLLKRHRSAFLHVSHVCNSPSPKKELFFFSWVLESFHSVFPGKLSTTLEWFHFKRCVAETIIDVGDGSITMFEA